MKLTSLKAAGALFVAAGLIVFGAALPAHAATLGSPTATATGTVTTGAVAYPLTITATTTTAGANAFDITLPTGWATSMVGSQNCTGATVTGMTVTGSGCAVNSGTITLYQNSGTLAAGTVISVTFAANKFTAAAARDFQLSTKVLNGSVVDTGTATLASGSTSTPTSTTSASTDPGLAATGRDNTGAIVLGAGFLAAGLVALAGVQVLRRRKNG